MLGVGPTRLPLDAMPLAYRMLAGRDLEATLAAMPADEVEQILGDWNLWRLPYQVPPEGDWSTWMLLGGRGIGKTVTSAHLAHEVAAEPERLNGGIIGLVGRTFTDVRLVNVMDATTGILATAPPGQRPRWQYGPGILTWPNGVIGRVFSAEQPDGFRGANLAFLIADELAAWPDSEATWNTIMMGLRIGRAQACITTTPKPLAWLRKLAAHPRTVKRTASTYDNPFLSRDRLAMFREAYGGSRLEAQELHGIFIDGIDGALLRGFEFRRSHLVPIDLVEIVVAIDPAVTEHKRSDMHGIIVYGVDARGHGTVLEDATGAYGVSNGEWAAVAIDCYQRWKANTIVVETNRGGKHVIAGLRALAPWLPVVEVNAARGKIVRAEPVGVLYEQGKISHLGEFTPLEAELTQWVIGDPSPNRMDALVWAVTHCHGLDPRTEHHGHASPLAAMSF